MAGGSGPTDDNKKFLKGHKIPLPDTGKEVETLQLPGGDDNDGGWAAALNQSQLVLFETGGRVGEGPQLLPHDLYKQLTTSLRYYRGDEENEEAYDILKAQIVKEYPTYFPFGKSVDSFVVYRDIDSGGRIKYMGMASRFQCFLDEIEKQGKDLDNDDDLLVLIKDKVNKHHYKYITGGRTKPSITSDKLLRYVRIQQEEEEKKKRSDEDSCSTEDDEVEGSSSTESEEVEASSSSTESDEGSSSAVSNKVEGEGEGEGEGEEEDEDDENKKKKKIQDELIKKDIDDNLEQWRSDNDKTVASDRMLVRFLQAQLRSPGEIETFGDLVEVVDQLGTYNLNSRTIPCQLAIFFARRVDLKALSARKAKALKEAAAAIKASTVLKATKDNIAKLQQEKADLQQDKAGLQATVNEIRGDLKREKKRTKRYRRQRNEKRLELEQLQNQEDEQVLEAEVCGDDDDNNNNDNDARQPRDHAATIGELQGERDVLRQDLDTTSERLATSTQDNAELRRLNEDLQGQLRDARQRQAAAVSAQLHPGQDQVALQRQLQDLVTQRGQERERVEELERQLQDQNDSRDQVTQLQQQLQAKGQELNGLHQRLQHSQASLATQRDQEELRVADLQRQHDQTIQTRDEANEQAVTGLQQEVAGLRDQVEQSALLRRENAEKTPMLASLQEQVVGLQQKVDERNAEFSEYQTAHDNAVGRCTRMKRELQVANTRVQELERQDQEKEAELVRLRGETADLHVDLGRAQAEITALGGVSFIGYIRSPDEGWNAPLIVNPGIEAGNHFIEIDGKLERYYFQHCYSGAGELGRKSLVGDIRKGYVAPFYDGSRDVAMGINGGSGSGKSKIFDEAIDSVAEETLTRLQEIRAEGNQDGGLSMLFVEVESDKARVLYPDGTKSEEFSKFNRFYPENPPEGAALVIENVDDYDATLQRLRAHREGCLSKVARMPTANNDQSSRSTVICILYFCGRNFIIIDFPGNEARDGVLKETVQCTAAERIQQNEEDRRVLDSNLVINQDISDWTAYIMHTAQSTIHRSTRTLVKFLHEKFFSKKNFLFVNVLCTIATDGDKCFKTLDPWKEALKKNKKRKVGHNT